ncbi:Zinc finger and NHL repeat domain containing protein [Oopsacas minuta]|uniref:Zinc finger and NHL repeat domain containing protein n=1 Tax=Oopsacas minuta TaxID=111878 RepID=A0AAV7JYK8_9METZ|nr:Zinc finger and NHL repeat domain containing protein [Oopsacas minuta]
MKGKRGVVEGEIASPRGVAVDKGYGLIYIVDFFTKIVSIYTLEGDFLKSFGRGILHDPHGICLSEEFVFVTNRGTNSITKFLKSGHLVHDSKYANPGLQLSLLSSLCTHNKYVYVCNRAKHRIELFNCDLLFIKSFGQRRFHCPEDIKINNDVIFVVTQSEQTIYAFSTDLEFISTISLTGQNISIAFFFTIDLNSNFIFSDFHAGRLEVFSSSGEHIDSLGDNYLSFPGGISMDGNNRIVTVSQSDINSIQIY